MPLPSAILQRICGLKVQMSTAEVVIGIEEVGIVDDEEEEKHGIAGDIGDKVEDGIANDEIGEIHDVVGEGDEVEVEVYVGVAIDA